MKTRKNLFTVCILSAGLLSACGGEGSASESSQPVAENKSPEAIMSSISEIEERSSYIINGTSSSDSDGDIVQYSWSLDSDDERLTLEDRGNGEAELIVNELIEDVNSTIKLTVKDDKGASSTSVTSFVAQEIDREKLPPRPDTEQSKTTVDGIDTNGNGIRDDVEWAIYNLYEESHTDREIAKTGGYALQKTMQAASTEGFSDNDEASRMLSKFIFCTTEYGEGDAGKMLSALQAFQFNTLERTEIYAQYNKSRSGTTQRIIEAEESECLFAEKGENHED